MDIASSHQAVVDDELLRLLISASTSIVATPEMALKTSTNAAEMVEKTVPNMPYIPSM